MVMLTSSASVVVGRLHGDIGPIQFAGWDAWSHLPPNQRDAAQWLQDHARDGDNLMEAVDPKGGDYNFSINRFANATGIPAVIGPQAHSFQWSPARSGQAGKEWDEVYRRRDAVQEYYSTGSAGRRSDILQNYNVRYVILGPEERLIYGNGPIADLEIACGNPRRFEGTSSWDDRVTICVN